MDSSIQQAFYSNHIHLDNQYPYQQQHHLQQQHGHHQHHQQAQQQAHRTPQNAHGLPRDIEQSNASRASNASPVGAEGYSISRRGTMTGLHHQRSHERLALDTDLSETRPPSIAGPSSGRSAGPASASFTHGHPHQHHHSQSRVHEVHGYDSAVSSPMDVVGPSHTHQPSASASAGGMNVQPVQEQQPMDEEPLYVNAKQYYRILKRRVARARLEELHRLSKQRKVSLRLLSFCFIFPFHALWLAGRYASQSILRKRRMRH